MYTTPQAMLYNPINYASVADVITFLMTCDMLRMATLLAGIVVLLERKNWPLDWLYRMVSLVGLEDCDAMVLMGHRRVLSTARPRKRFFYTLVGLIVFPSYLKAALLNSA